ncbi:PfkB family carbohydrate kinase [Nocardia implantans]|uniref:PfkB family carbohydrate kinase n=1 Tax=Nocardia implantans TaxID=3108168 RepID=UPI002B061757|nr:PfkB family carbohydrate kinase [Nocardia sp. CDC192]
MAAGGPLVVIGDALLDIDLDGRADRCSAGSAAPVVDVAHRTFRPGGAGLAARLAAADGAEVVLIAGFAADEAGARLRGLLDRHVRVVALPLRGATVCKQRVRARGRGPPPTGPGGAGPAGRPGLPTRRDSGAGRGGADPLPEEAVAVLAAARAVLVSDHGGAAAAHPQIRKVLRARAEHIPIVWDPSPRGPVPVPGAALVTPDHAAALTLLSGRLDDGPDLWKLAKGWAVDAIAVTLGTEGALLCLRASGKRLRIPLASVERVPGGGDACGAGDSFAVAAAVRLAEGRGPESAVRRAVLAAAEFVGSGGAAAYSERESVAVREENPCVPDDHLEVRKPGATSMFPW